MESTDIHGPRDVGKKLHVKFKSGDEVIGTLKSVQQDLANYQTNHAGLIEGAFGGKFGVSTTVTLAIARHTMEVSLSGDAVQSFDFLGNV